MDITEGDPMCYLSPFVRQHVKKAIETEALVNLAMLTLTADNWRLHSKFKTLYWTYSEYIGVRVKKSEYIASV